MAAPKLSSDDVQRFLGFADALADAARDAILPYFRAALTIDNKQAQSFDPVTEADRAAEAAMRALIEREFPTHGILGEEDEEKPSADGYQWVLDPIDGTRAFIAGLPTWGVLIALNYQGAPLIGVMDQPYLDERFRGWNDGAELTTDGITKPIKTRACAALSDAILSSTDPYLFKDAEYDAFQRVRNAAKLTRYGYDCYAYSMLAAGGIDVVVESGLKPYDIQALIPIIRGAGGDVIAWDGGDAAQGGRVLAVGDKRLAQEAMTLLS
jgi:histidinol phosphatase-like enzyme (inositol monophosphatase family)